VTVERAGPKVIMPDKRRGANGPKDIPNSVAAGSAASMRAAIVLPKGGEAD